MMTKLQSNGIAIRTTSNGTLTIYLPLTWRCPECKILKAKKGVFKPLDE